MKFKVFSFIPLLFLPISIISTEHNFFELEKISIVNYQKNEIENKKMMEIILFLNRILQVQKITPVRIYLPLEMKCLIN